jgi:hypothetical protein
MDCILDLLTQLGTTSNYRAIATAANTKSRPQCQQSFPGNGFQQWRFFSFLRSGPSCSANIPQRKSLNSYLHRVRVKSYFTTGGLPPISSFWRQSPLRLTTSNYFQLNTCFKSPYVRSSLRRGWVCGLQLLLVLASAITLMSESRGTHYYSLLPHIRDSPNPRIHIPQQQGGPVIPPGTGFPFCHLLRLAGLRWKYSIPPPHRINYILLLSSWEVA